MSGVIHSAVGSLRQYRLHTAMLQAVVAEPARKAERTSISVGRERAFAASSWITTGASWSFLSFGCLVSLLSEGSPRCCFHGQIIFLEFGVQTERTTSVGERRMLRGRKASAQVQTPAPPGSPPRDKIKGDRKRSLSDNFHQGWAVSGQQCLLLRPSSRTGPNARSLFCMPRRPGQLKRSPTGLLRSAVAHMYALGCTTSRHILQ